MTDGEAHEAGTSWSSCVLVRGVATVLLFLLLSLLLSWLLLIA